MLIEHILYVGCYCELRIQLYTRKIKVLSSWVLILVKRTRKYRITCPLCVPCRTSPVSPASNSKHQPSRASHTQCAVPSLQCFYCSTVGISNCHLKPKLGCYLLPTPYWIRCSCTQKYAAKCLTGFVMQSFD